MKAFTYFGTRVPRALGKTGDRGDIQGESTTEKRNPGLHMSIIYSMLSSQET